MPRKKFNKALYDSVDAPSRNAVRKYLDEHGVMHSNCEDYGVDLRALHPIGHECEVKLAWKGVWPKPWKTVHIPERKKKLFDIERVYFWIMRSDYKQAWVIDSVHLNDSLLVEIPNKEVPSGELFYDIPVTIAKLVNL